MFLCFKKKMSFFCMFLLMCTLLMTGCEGKTDKNGSTKAEDGRSYGGVIEGKMGEHVSTAFFDMTVEDAVKYETFQFADGLYQPDAGNTYLVVTFTLKNTYGTDLAMSITDFSLDYEGVDENVTGFGKAYLGFDDYMDDLFTLNVGEEITKKVLYTVPDREAYTIGYSEYYEDQFVGNRFVIPIAPVKKIVTARVDCIY